MEKELKKAAMANLEDNSGLEKLLKQVIEMDERQQQLTDAAEHLKGLARGQVTQQIEKIKEDYTRRGEAKMADIEMQERQQVKVALAQSRQQLEEKSARLDAIFAQKKDTLVEQLVSRTLAI